MGQAIAWDGVEKSGVKEKFLTDKEISKVLHEESIEPEDNNDEAIAVRNIFSFVFNTLRFI